MPTTTLTFDNGPYPGITDHVLEVLARHGLKATFFVVGERLKQCRALAAEAWAEGHWLGNHTMRHGAPLGERPEPSVVDAEVRAMEDLIGDLRHERRFFRPNGRGKIGPHLLSTEAVAFLAANHSSIVTWTNVPADRGASPDWVDGAIDHVMSAERSLLVLHDRPSGHDLPHSSMGFLDEFLIRARDRGVDFEQDFPPACVPMETGVAGPSLADLVTRSQATASHHGSA